MRLVKVSVLIVVFFGLGIFLAQNLYANGGRSGRRKDDYYSGKRFYRHHRYYPKSYYYFKKIYYFPYKRYYYYYDAYPDKTYYYDWEKPASAANPSYLPITSIVNMASQGVPESVIISEIERTGSQYKLDMETINYLKQNGVSDAVIDVMLRKR